MSFSTPATRRAFTTPTGTASNSSSSSSSSSSTASDYEKQLSQWAHVAENQKAYAVIMAWTEKGNPGLELDLSRLGLDSLPPLPAGVKKLNANHNRITEITEDLPSTLVDVSLNNNRLLAVPRSLPWDTLNTLDLRYNRITHLPSELATVNPVCDLWLGNNPIEAGQFESLDTDRHGLSRLKLGFALAHRSQTAKLSAPFAPRFRNRQGEDLLFTAIDCNRADKVEQLLAQGEIDPNCRAPDQTTPLLRATLYGYKKIVRLLSLDPRVNPNLPYSDGSAALGVALVCKPFEMACVDALLNHPASNPNLPNANGVTPLHEAVIYRNGELLSRLLDHPRLNPNALCSGPDAYPVSALTLALIHVPDMAALILAHPATDVNAGNGVAAGTGQRRSSLSVAVNHRRSELIVPILEKGARVDPDLDRRVQRIIALAAGKYYLETLTAPDQFLHEATGGNPGAQAEQVLSASGLAAYRGMKKDANALLKRLYGMKGGPAQQSVLDLAFRLASMAWYSRQAPDSTNMYSYNPSPLRLKQLRILNNVITMRALPREQWSPVAVEVARWLQLLGSAGAAPGEPEERLLDVPRRDLPALTRDVLEAWRL